MVKMVINNELKRKADLIFWIFEDKFFKNQGNYPRNTNLVLEFSDFISNATQESLAPYLKFSSDQEFCDFKQMISNGIDCWLDDGNLKTLLLSN